MQQAFRSSIFSTINAEQYQYYDDGLMVIQDGLIQAIGHYQDFSPEFLSRMPVVEYENSLICPGFVDAHIHYPQQRIIASYGEKLLDWLNNYTFPEETKFSDPQYAEQIAKLFFDEIIRQGTTTVQSFCTSHPQSVEAFFNEATKRNMRVFGGKVMMNRNAPDALCDTVESSYQDSKQLIEKWHNKNRIKYTVSPRFAPTSTAEQLQKAGQLLSEYASNHRDGVNSQTHINENLDEIAWVQSLYPSSQHYLDVYQTHGCLHESMVFGHLIHNQTDELQKIADSGAKVALCPTSNLFLGSGLFDYATLKSLNITCALASDIGGGNSFSMFQVMNEAYKICQLQGYSLSANEAFYLATLSAAKTLQVDHLIGNLDTGKEADFIVIDYHATPLTKQRIGDCRNIEEKLFALIMLANQSHIQQVYVMGQPQLG